MYIDYKLIPNGENYTKLYIFSCDNCNQILNDSDPRYTEASNDYDLCLECAFRKNKISSDFYIDYSGFDSSMFNAGINPKGQIELWSKRTSTPPWDRSNRQQRNSSKYVKWRNHVFERDNYTCQHCNQRGGELNAHHIKEFSKYPDKRFDLDNGLTLCVACHKEVHRKKR